MRWEGRRKSSNVEDKRGSGSRRHRAGFPQIRLPRTARGTRRAGGGSIGLVVIIVLGLWLFAGINPLQLIQMLNGDTAPTQQQAGGRAVPSAPAANDPRADFLKVVLAETENTWNTIFTQSGANYTEPTLVLYTDAEPTACGFGSAAAGPFYCPADQRIYVDLSFFDLLARRLGAPGDFAQAYVLAHEVGHHVQNLTGVLGDFQSKRQGLNASDANALSIRVELQADCYAGIWARSADRVGIVEDGDLEEALDAAAAVGDDTIQRRQQGYVVPESFNHGTAEQRERWFRRGYQSGNPADCDTFDTARL